MRHEASFDNETCAMFNLATQEPLDVLAVLPGHAPDMALLVDMLTPEQAGELARMAAWRALGWMH